MMRVVRLTRDMRPCRAGDTYLIDAELADRLIAAGDARPILSVYTPTAPAAPPAIDQPAAPPRRPYKTRGA